VRPLSPYPGWTFGADWDNPDAAYQARRRLWEYFHDGKLELPFVFEWYDRLQLHLYLGNDLSRQLFVAGCVEPNEFAFLAQILVPGAVFVDGGANEGLYTLFAARGVGANGVVLSVEPSRREFDRLTCNVRLNKLDNVRLHRLALADQDGEAELAIAGYEHEGQNTLGAFVHHGVALERTERVVLRTLDHLAADEHLERLDVLKLDVEGAELRVLLGARDVLQKFRPILLFEVVEPALRKQGGSFEQIREFLGNLQYGLFTFDRDGCPAPAPEGMAGDNMIAVPREKPVAAQLASRPSRGFGAKAALEQSEPLPALSSAAGFTPARAYWNQRSVLASERSRILALSQAVDHPHDLLLYQWAQLMAAVIDYAPDLVLELGRGPGNSTCAFTEAAHVNQSRTRVLSLCLSDDWERVTVPRLLPVVRPDWFQPLQALRGDILEFDYPQALASAQRVIVFWDAHGFEVAECVLGCILPALADKDHLVIMHDLSDSRYGSEEHLAYGEHGLWKGNNWSGPRLKLGVIDSAVEQSIATLDFTTRNHLTLDSADHSFRTELTPQQQAEMSRMLGELFDLQGHWFYFSLNEKPGPYRFPRYLPPSQRVKPEERPPEKRWRFFRR
jgi:FkbM family methyltransferase